VIVIIVVVVVVVIRDSEGEEGILYTFPLPF